MKNIIGVNPTFVVFYGKFCKLYFVFGLYWKILIFSFDDFLEKMIALEASIYQRFLNLVQAGESEQQSLPSKVVKRVSYYTI